VGIMASSRTPGDCRSSRSGCTRWTTARVR
jgi:hypothetical protein